MTWRTNKYFVLSSRPESQLAEDTSPTISTVLGYRVLDTDYQDGGFSYNVTRHGLFSSVAFRF